MSGVVLALVVLAGLAVLCIVSVAAAAVCSSGQRESDRRSAREWQATCEALARKLPAPRNGSTQPR